MPLQKLQFRPGVNREGTTLANEGGWFDCDKVRFRSGYPEKIGGWSVLTYTKFGKEATPAGMVPLSEFVFSEMYLVACRHDEREEGCGPGPGPAGRALQKEQRESS